jgi:hypothetical protein
MANNDNDLNARMVAMRVALACSYAERLKSTSEEVLTQLWNLRNSITDGEEIQHIRSRAAKVARYAHYFGTAANAYYRNDEGQMGAAAGFVHSATILSLGLDRGTLRPVDALQNISAAIAKVGAITRA